MVHLATISAHHPAIQDHTAFSHHVVARFFKGLTHIFPLMQELPHSWDLHVVLFEWMGLFSEPMALCLLHHHTMKTAFLMAITSVLWGSASIPGGPSMHCFSQRSYLGSIQNFSPRWFLSSI